jgi:hypothetical protein
MSFFETLIIGLVNLNFYSKHLISKRVCLHQRLYLNVLLVL